MIFELIKQSIKIKGKVVVEIDPILLGHDSCLLVSNQTSEIALLHLDHTRAS